jgi:predicted ATPase
MGTVYRAHDRLRGENVALKRVGPTLVQPFADPQLRLALAHEFQALAGLHHPHIIAVRDYGFDRTQQPYFTMELLAGARTIIEAGQFQDLHSQIQLLLQMLYALAYLHRRNVVHRDLKPGNVLVEGRTVKVLDFGLATTAGQITAPTATLSYAAPEVLRGEPATLAADLFATGVMAYELLAGWHPFGQSPQEAVAAILHAEPDWNYLNLAPPLVQVLQRLLAKDPNNRYPDTTAVIAALNVATGQALPLETQATRESFLQAAPFIGRADELTQLQAALNAAVQGQAGAWLIAGESGVGKSRLLSEVRTQALVQGVQVLHGQAPSSGGAYHLWRDSLRWLSLLCEPTNLEAAVLQALLPDLPQLLGRSLPTAPVLEPKAAQARLFSTISDLLRRAAQQQPLLLLLEDLHWADANSLELLQWLQRLLQSPDGTHLPILLIASYRRDEAPHLATQLAAMHVLPLQRLSTTAIADLSAMMLGAKGRRASLVAFLQKETEGNAFFVVEVLRTLAAEAGQLDRITDMALPTQVFAGGIQQVVQRRLQRVPTPYQPLLQQAAIAGRRLDLTVLAALTSPAELESWLTLCANALVLEIQDGRWQFHHDKLREGILAALDQPQHQSLHQQIGETIEQVYAAQLASHYADLAYHFEQAQDLVRVRRYLQLAGEAAQASYANAAAIDYYTRLLPYLTADDEQFEILLKLGAVLKVVGQWEAAEARYQAALAIAEARQDPSAQARCYQAIGSLLRGRSDFPGALAWLSKAQQLFVTINQPARQCEVLIEMGHVGYQQGEYEQARHSLEAGLAQARALDDRYQIGQALHALGNVTFDQGDYGATHTLYHESLAIRRAIGDQVGLGATLTNLGILAMYQADFATSQALYEEGLAIRREIGDRHGIAISLNNLGIVAKEQGDLAGALALYEEALAIQRELGSKQSMAYARNNIAAVLVAQGHLVQAQALYEESLAQRREIGDKWGIASTLSSLGDVAVARTDFVTAQQNYRESLLLFQEIGDKQKIAYGLLGMAAVAANLANSDAQQIERGVRLAAAAEALMATHGLHMESNSQRFFAETVANLRTMLDDATFARHWQAGQALDVNGALVYALAP